jgi:hypothetical protein
LPLDILGLRSRAKVTAGIQVVVTQQVPAAAVELIGSGLELDLHIGAGVSAIFGRIVAGLDLEYLNGVDDRRRRSVIAASLDDAGTIIGDRLLTVARAVS